MYLILHSKYRKTNAARITKFQSKIVVVVLIPYHPLICIETSRFWNSFAILMPRTSTPTGLYLTD